MANQQRLADNASNYERRMRGATRPGAALLAGLVVCGHCGRHLEGASIEAAVVAACFEALAPAELDLLDEVLAAQHREQARLRRQLAEQVMRAEYEVRLVEKQYLAVDPDHRLVAAELERRWEQALQALAAAREVAEQETRTAPTTTLDPALRAQLRDLGPALPALWASGRFTATQQKELVRSLIRRVILSRPVAATIEVKIVWVSGAFSELTVHPGLQRTADLGDYDRLIARLADLTATGLDDAEIARRLTADGFRRARQAGWSADSVGKVRRDHGLVSVRAQFRQQDHLDGQWTVPGLARHLGVPRKWLNEAIARGAVPATRHPHAGHDLIVDDPAVLAQIRAADEARRRRQAH